MRTTRRIRGLQRWLGMAALLIPAFVIFAVGCKAEDGKKAEQVATTTAEPVVEKAVQAVAPAPQPEVVKAEAGPTWPDQVPSTWKIINDFESIPNDPKTPKMNLWGGYWDVWTYHGGQCKVTSTDDGGKRLKVEFVLPLEDSECGTYEYLKGPKGKPEEVDIRGFERVAFMIKSGDDAEHAIRLEVVELDKYDAALQGYTGTSNKLIASKDWVLHELPLDGLLHEFFDRRHGKSVGIRIQMKDQAIDGASGTILIDNITFIEKAAKATEGKENPK